MDDLQARDGSGQHDVEAAQAGALVGLGGGDGRRLDDDDPVAKMVMRPLRGTCRQKRHR